MPAMIRFDKKAQKIVKTILGINPVLQQKKYSSRKAWIRKRLNSEETSRIK